MSSWIDRRKVPVNAGDRWEKVRSFFWEGWDHEIGRWHIGQYEVAYGETDDGKGVEVRDVIAIVDLPKPYPPRVFFKRWWRAPDGYTFGSPRLRCMALPNFKGWRDEFGNPAWKENMKVMER